MDKTEFEQLAGKTISDQEWEGITDVIIDHINIGINVNFDDVLRGIARLNNPPLRVDQIEGMASLIVVQ